MKVEICKYPNGANAIFSLSFDDGCYYDSTLFTIELFEKIYKETGVKLKGTVAQTVNFISPKLRELWQGAIENGWYDIAGHSVTHCISYCSSTPIEELEKDASQTYKALKEMYPSQKIAAFFTPGGGYDKTGGDVIAKYYLANRTAGEKVNYPGQIDWYNVSSFTAKMDRDTKDFCDYIDETINTQGWGVQMNHWITEKEQDVHHSQRKNTFIEECYYLASQVKKGLVNVVSFEEAVLYLRKAQASTLEIKDNKITINCKNNSPHLADVPLTIAIFSDTPLTITENGKKTTCPSQNGVVLASIIEQATIE
ncbi:MAG: hypothetical protein IJ400_07095 [Clostridia bacterium]|nr:hypothetical protein [Clostridia bacterium]